MSSDGVLGLTHGQMRGLALLAELRFPGEGMQAAHAWDWQAEGRLVLDAYLARHTEALESWAASAEQRTAAAAERANVDAQAAIERTQAWRQEV
jgi:hypothetical protein